jgi:catechol 2,3-dioxygenase-like lactoylglutathione lyase family enzyme
MIKVNDLSHVVFRAPDLELMARFLTDFGLTATRDGDVLYARGYNTEPYLHITELGEPGFAGFGFRANSIDDVVALGRSEGVEPERVMRPGGGLSVTLRDPDGFLVEVISGQTPDVAVLLPEKIVWNSAHERLRLRTAKRTGTKAAHVVRLGHCVLNVSDFRLSEAWYKQRFGLITSDEIEVSSEESIGAFLRCDRGGELTDHHTLFLIQGRDGVSFNHAAFEVVDFDDLQAGHQRLRNAGWTSVWGIGRHVLGSQVFDYWNDPWGQKLEHWTDGDLFTAADGSNRAPLSELRAVQWGPLAPVSR